MVEFALVVPILLALILGGLQVGMALLIRTQLTHAAQQGAAAGAADPAVPQRCDTALATVTAVYGQAPDQVTCTQPGNLLEIRAVDEVPLLSPFGPWTVAVSARAVVP